MVLPKEAVRFMMTRINCFHAIKLIFEENMQGETKMYLH